MSKYLIVNPNSSVAVTEDMKQMLSPVIAEGDSVNFFTADPNSGAPTEITNYETSKQSHDASFNKLLKMCPKYDNVLICCYSLHPLVESLNRALKQKASDTRSSISKIPAVVGIFESSLLYAVSRFPKNFIIFTSSSSWENILDNSVEKFFGGVKLPFFKGTFASNVNVTDLNNPENFKLLVNRLAIILQDQNQNNPEVVLLGCAGFSGLETKFKKAFPGLDFVDSVKIGYKVLEAFQ